MILQTERLVLRRWRETDAESLYEYAKDPAVGPIAGWPAHKSLEESQAVIRDVFQGPECYAICELGRDRAIGAVELMLNGSTNMTDREDECELGYWLGEAYWGRGIMTQAVRQICEEAFRRFQLLRIDAEPFAGNAASRSVLEKAGFTLEGIMRRSVYKNGEVLDACMYSLLREELP